MRILKYDDRRSDNDSRLLDIQTWEVVHTGPRTPFSTIAFASEVGSAGMGSEMARLPSLITGGSCLLLILFFLLLFFPPLAMSSID